jgi:ankyrin repeat protein
VNVEDNIGETALMKAARKGHLPVVRLLLDRGAFWSPTSTSGQTALSLAIDAGHQDVVGVLIAAGAKVEPTVAVAVTGLGAVGFNYTEGTYITGFIFRANSAISVTHFGYYDSNLTGRTETFAAHPVGLYDLSTHTLLESTTVQPSDPVTGLFHYAALANPSR